MKNVDDPFFSDKCIFSNSKSEAKEEQKIEIILPPQKIDFVLYVKICRLIQDDYQSLELTQFKEKTR